MEIWKDVAGWEGLYQVSNHGRVKILARTCLTRNRWGPMIRHRPEKIRKASIAKGGHYPRIGFEREGRKGWADLHVLVCETFNGPKPGPGYHCAHNDGNPLNNRADNLRWATPRENAADTMRHGRFPQGEKSNLSKLTADQVRAIRSRAEAGETAKVLAAEFDLTREGVSAIIKRKNWRHI